MENKLVTKGHRPVWRRPKRPPRPVTKIAYDFGRYSETEYLQDLSRKNIIIVGPASYLRGQGKGEFIDSFDYVVRVNHAIPVEYPEDYGSRTDILYHILSRRNLGNAGKKLIGKEEIALWKKTGIKWMVSRHDVFSKRVREMGPKINGAFPWICVRGRFYDKIRQAIKKAPNTGTVAIAHMLTSGLNELHIIGFDFYRSGVYSGYGDFRPGEEAMSVNGNWHDTESQIEYLRKVADRDIRLKPDETLKNILFTEQA